MVNFVRYFYLFCNCAAGSPSDYYDVIGVVGLSSSSIAVAANQMLAPAKVPVISCCATNDKLSNKTDFPYFLRVIPPNR